MRGILCRALHVEHDCGASLGVQPGFRDGLLFAMFLSDAAGEVEQIQASGARYDAVQVRSGYTGKIATTQCSSFLKMIATCELK